MGLITSLTPATTSNLGVVKVGTELVVENGGLLSVSENVMLESDGTPSAPATIYALKSTELLTTLLAANWVGAAAPYTYTLTVNGVTSTTNADLLPTTNINITQLSELQLANIIDGGQSTNTFTLKAFGDKPTIDLPVRIIIKGDM